MSDLVEGDFMTIKLGSYIIGPASGCRCAKWDASPRAEQTRLVSLYIFRQTAPVCRRAGGLVRVRARKAPRGAGDQASDLEEGPWKGRRVELQLSRNLVQRALK